MTSDWQNRETANIGLVGSVGRALARQSGGHFSFKSRSSQFFFVHPKCITITVKVNLPVLGKVQSFIYHTVIYTYHSALQNDISFSIPVCKAKKRSPVSGHKSASKSVR